MAGWSKPPGAFIKVVEEDLTKQRRILTMEVLQGVVMMSPVDKGTFRGSHQVTVDSISTGFDLEKQDKSGGETISEGLAVIGAIDKPYGESTVQTNLPYAEALEDGSSTQAPAGVYGVTFDAVAEKHK